MVQVPWAGYQLGVGNQSIQVPFLERLHDPSLFPRDEMVQRTLARYPTFFFRALAPALRWLTFPDLYLAMHLVTAAAVLAAAGALARVMTGRAGAGVVVALFLLAGHHHALADQTLYAAGFTHTWAVWPWLVAALACWYGGHPWAAFALTGLLVNFHALEAGQLAAVLTVGAVGEQLALSWRRRFSAASQFDRRQSPPPEGWPEPQALSLSNGSDEGRGGSVGTPCPALRDQPNPPRPPAQTAARASTPPQEGMNGGPAADHGVRGWWRVGALVGLLVVGAAPTLWMLAREAQAFDARWLEWTRLRSALHSFPSAWWRPGNPEVPRFALLLGLAAVAWGWQWPGAARRRTLWLGAGTVLLWVVGTLLTEVWTVPVVVRAQLFRSARLVAVVALAWVAAGCWRGWALPFARDRQLAAWRAWLEFGSATLTALVLVWPAAIVLLPVALAVAWAVALVNGRLGWVAAAVTGGALLVTLAAWQATQFVVPGLSAGFTWAAVWAGHGPGLVGWGLLAVAGLVGLGAWSVSCPSGGRCSVSARVASPAAPTERRPPATADSTTDLWRWAQAVVAVGVLMIAAVAVRGVWRGLAVPVGTEAGWWAAQQWAREHTPLDALFLTPVQQGGFRILSQRSVVGEWRDGTQLYFSAAFGPVWWERMNALQPGMRAAPDGQRLLVRGRSLGEQTDEELIGLAQRFGATHVVAPADAARRLVVAYTNAAWGIYRPAIAPPPATMAADEVKQAAFLREVVAPNIEKHRQSPVRVQVVGTDGRPLYDATYRITQTNSLFLFGVSLPPFVVAGVAAQGADGRLGTSAATGQVGQNADGRLGTSAATVGAPTALVTSGQLARVAGVFNFSVVTRSAWWSSLEPQEGQRRFEDLDRYLGWCQEHGLATEFSFLSGFGPGWLADKPEADQLARFERHAVEVVARGGDKVAFWEVTNRGVWLGAATNLMTKLRANQPGLKLGLSDAGRFASRREGPARDADLARGLADLRQLKAQGVAVDFVAIHGHEPWGMRADPQTMYEVLDAFAKEGVPIHVTEFAAPAAGPLPGGAAGAAWDPRRQAEYCRLAWTVFFSHPAVTAVNYAALGPESRWPAAGLFGADGEPRPAYDALRDLITRQWRTRTQGRLALDGRVQFRGFHGDYELQVTLKGGQSARVGFRVAPGQDNAFRFQCDAATGRLVPVQ